MAVFCRPRVLEGNAAPEMGFLISMEMIRSQKSNQNPLLVGNLQWWLALRIKLMASLSKHYLIYMIEI